jgi:hypothetical protein
MVRVVPLDANGFRRDKMMPVLVGIRDGADIVPPVRLTSAGIVKHLTARAGGTSRNSPTMGFLTTSIESTGLTRWSFGLGALTLLGVFAIALALALPDSFTP